MSSKTCRCCLKLQLCRVQVRLQWQKAGVRTSPDGLQQNLQVQSPPYKSQLPRHKDTRRTELSSRTTRAEWDNCLSWLSDAHGTKRILSDLYFAPLLHPKSQTPAGAASVYRIWMLDLLPWQQVCVCFFNLFSWQALLLASKMWRRFSIGAELTHNTQDANNGDTVKHSGHVVAGGWLSFCSLGVWQSINLSLFLRSPNLS